MALVDRIGTFRGVVTDHAVSVTTNGFPQLVASLQGLEYYDGDEKVWVDWSEQDENEIIAYLVLFGGKDKETLTCKQIKKVFGWSGKSFAELNDMDLSAIKLQFRVKENTYEGNTSMQVEWIDDHDATPGRSVRKLEKKELAELDAKYSNILKAASGGPTPAKAPAEAPVVKKNPPKAPKIAATKTTKKAPTVTQATAAPEVPARADMPTGKRTKKEAWGNVVDLKDKGVTDQQLSEAWCAACEKIAGKKTPDSEITPEQWFLIQEAVFNETAAF